MKEDSGSPALQAVDPHLHSSESGLGLGQISKTDFFHCTHVATSLEKPFNRSAGTRARKGGRV